MPDLDLDAIEGKLKPEAKLPFTIELQDDIRALIAECRRLKFAFGEFAHATGQAEGVWFVPDDSETARIAEECQEYFMATRQDHA